MKDSLILFAIFWIIALHLEECCWMFLGNFVPLVGLLTFSCLKKNIQNLRFLPVKKALILGCILCWIKALNFFGSIFGNLAFGRCLEVWCCSFEGSSFFWMGFCFFWKLINLQILTVCLNFWVKMEIYEFSLRTMPDRRGLYFLGDTRLEEFFSSIFSVKVKV